MEVKSEFSDCDVDYMYCRCCFQLFTDSCNRYDFTFDFLSSIHDLFQFKLKFEGTDSSRWICEKCYEIVTNFRKFKNETLEKQAKFSMLIATNQHKELSYIQNLTMTTVALELEFEDEKMMIKDEPMEDLPQTVVFETPEMALLEPYTPLKIKEGYKEYKKKSWTKTENPKTSNRPSYERNKNPVRCNICKNKYLNITSHRIKKHGLQFEFKCNKDKNCKFTTFDYKTFANHRKTHDPPRPKRMKLVCPYCAVKCSSLNAHIKNVHLKVRRFFCDICGYGAFQKNILQQHIESIHFEKSIVCSECGWKTNMESKLNRHIDYMHKKINREKNFICTYPECNRACDTKFILRDHIRRVHHRILNFPCKYPGCSKMLFTKSELDRHIQHAHGAKCYTCETCGKSYSSLILLKNHTKSKHEELKHVCKECNRSFFLPHMLEKHFKRKHAQIKDYKCDQCDKCFFDRRYLEHHFALVHLGIRFECQVPGCKSSLSRRDVYKTHLKSHNLNQSEMKELMQKCKEFMAQNNLRNHF